MKVEKILETLTYEELEKLYNYSQIYNRRFIAMIVVSIGSGWFISWLNSENINNSIHIFSLFMFVILVLIRIKFNNKNLENVYLLILGFIFSLFLLESNLIANYNILIFTTIIYFIGSKLIKKSSFISLLNQKVTHTESDFSVKQKISLVTIGGTLPLVIGNDLKSILLIFGTFIVSMIAASNICNGYYSVEQRREMKRNKK